MEASLYEFSKFVTLIRTVTDNDFEVVKLLQKRFNKARMHYIESEDFRRALATTRAKIEGDTVNKYVHVREFVVELKAYEEKPVKKERREEERPVKNERRKKEEEEEGGDNATPSTSSRRSRSPQKEKRRVKLELCEVKKEAKKQKQVKEESDNESDTETEVVDEKHARFIRKLEKLLGKVSAEIERLESRELTLDELSDEQCTYLMLDRYKKKFVKIWERICSLKGRSTNTGRVVEEKFKYSGTKYLEINNMVEKFINKFKAFPDFSDVYEIVQKCRTKYHLKLSKKMVDMVAKDVFTEVGNALQERRQKDLVQNFGCQLTDRFKTMDDPALYDRGLRAKLESNHKKGKTNLEAVISKYAYRQEEDGDGTDDDSDDDDDKESSPPSPSKKSRAKLRVVSSSKETSGDEQKYPSSAHPPADVADHDDHDDHDDAIENPPPLPPDSPPNNVMEILEEEEEEEEMDCVPSPILPRPPRNYSFSDLSSSIHDAFGITPPLATGEGGGGAGAVPSPVKSFAEEVAVKEKEWKLKGCNEDQKNAEEEEEDEEDASCVVVVLEESSLSTDDIVRGQTQPTAQSNKTTAAASANDSMQGKTESKPASESGKDAENGEASTAVVAPDVEIVKSTAPVSSKTPDLKADVCVLDDSSDDDKEPARKEDETSQTLRMIVESAAKKTLQVKHDYLKKQEAKKKQDDTGRTLQKIINDALFRLPGKPSKPSKRKTTESVVEDRRASKIARTDKDKHRPRISTAAAGEKDDDDVHVIHMLSDSDDDAADSRRKSSPVNVVESKQTSPVRLSGKVGFSKEVLKSAANVLSKVVRDAQTGKVALTVSKHGSRAPEDASENGRSDVVASPVPRSAAGKMQTEPAVVVPDSCTDVQCTESAISEDVNENVRCSASSFAQISSISEKKENMDVGDSTEPIKSCVNIKVSSSEVETSTHQSPSKRGHGQQNERSKYNQTKSSPQVETRSPHSPSKGGQGSRQQHNQSKDNHTKMVSKIANIQNGVEPSSTNQTTHITATASGGQVAVEESTDVTNTQVPQKVCSTATPTKKSECRSSSIPQSRKAHGSEQVQLNTRDTAEVVVVSDALLRKESTSTSVDTAASCKLNGKAPSPVSVTETPVQGCVTEEEDEDDDDVEVISSSQESPRILYQCSTSFKVNLSDSFKANARKIVTGCARSINGMKILKPGHVGEVSKRVVSISDDEDDVPRKQRTSSVIMLD